VTGDSRRVLNDGKYEYRYDDEGNLTQKQELLTGNLTTYEWDYRNRLTTVVSGNQTVEYGYDAEDKRVGTKLNGVTTEQYVYDGTDIALVLNAAGTLVERYLFGAGVDNVLSRERSGVVVWSLGDRQGSVVDLVSENGTVLNHFVYDGFGTRTGTTSSEFRYGYTGRELDTETGLYYYRARYYDSKVGRFISEDPIGFSAGDTNLYRYVGNNSPNYTDPTGTLISGWAEDFLYGVDSLAAGIANFATLGLTNKIRAVLPNGANKVAERNQEGLLYNIGTGIGIFATVALNPAGAGAAWARGTAGAVQVYGATYGALESAGNILKGEGSAWDALNFIPVLQLARASRGSRTVSSAIVEADAVKRSHIGVSGANSRHITEFDEHEIFAYESLKLPDYTTGVGNRDDLRSIVEQTSIPEDVLETVWKHLFVNKHRVPIPDSSSNSGNVIAEGLFSRDITIAKTWQSAKKGFNDGLDKESFEKFKRLIPHEYIESQLMSDGIPYISPHKEAWAKGFYASTPKHFGAHDLSVNLNPTVHPFRHWSINLNLSYDLIPTLPTELSQMTKANLDEIVDAIRATIKGKQSPSVPDNMGNKWY
jgi:RHS repeat-associated protein